MSGGFLVSPVRTRGALPGSPAVDYDRVTRDAQVDEIVRQCAVMRAREQLEQSPPQHGQLQHTQEVPGSPWGNATNLHTSPPPYHRSYLETSPAQEACIRRIRALKKSVEDLETQYTTQGLAMHDTSTNVLSAEVLSLITMMDVLSSTYSLNTAASPPIYTPVQKPAEQEELPWYKTTPALMSYAAITTLALCILIAIYAPNSICEDVEYHIDEP